MATRKPAKDSSGENKEKQIQDRLEQTRVKNRKTQVESYKKMIYRWLEDIDDREAGLVNALATAMVVSDQLMTKSTEIISDRERSGLDRALEVAETLNDPWYNVTGASGSALYE